MKHIFKTICLLLITCSHTWGQAPAEEAENQLREPVPEKSDRAALKIIKNHLTVLGGVDNIKRIRNKKINIAVTEGKKEYTITRWQAAPNKIKEKETRKHLGSESHIIEGCNGELAWIYDLTRKHPFPQEKNKKELETIIRKTHFYGPFIDHEAKGLKFSYEGKVKSRGRNCYLVKMFYPNGLIEYFYFDTKNFMVSRHGWQENVKGSIVDRDNFIIRYQKVQGVWIEEVIELAIENQVFGKFVYEDVEMNLSLPDDFFDLPKVKEVWVKTKIETCASL